MERSSRLLLPVMALAVALCLAASASAAPVCTNDTNLHQYVCYDPFGPAVSNFSRSVPLPQFNSSLGSLTKIEHFASAHLQGDFTISNYDAEAQDFQLTAQSTVKMRYGSATGTALVTVVPLYQGTVPVGSGDTETISKTVDVSATGTTYYGASLTDTIRTRYIGTGTVPFYISTVTVSGVLGSGDYDFSAAVTTNGIAKVIYTYVPTEIPEPATMFLIGSSLLALGFGRRLKTLSA